ncbi:uncharacterized protein LOC127253235 [Andrographis paniculata]|uniref:uncharacterized protein LOC127253235 n=1 Tax=Andrographis paniculata TaxID=175694 RepID=UPI0021E7CB14|nr:uncharacterized protein LOC127253235 [Andrographis paniculata]
MASGLQRRRMRRVAMRKKLQVLKALIKSKSVKKSSIVMDAFLYICNLRLQVEAIKREYQYLINHIQQVKVEKVGRGYLTVVVTCKKVAGEQVLVSILEEFERMNLNVLQARVSCNHIFGMEAIVAPAPHHIHSTTTTTPPPLDDVDAAALHQAILNVVQTQTNNNNNNINSAAKST